MSIKSRSWILVDVSRCTGCRLCEIACSLRHEKTIWPSASRIQVFEPYPGAPVPILCVQCYDYPCVNNCSFNALYIDENVGSVMVIPDNCTLCGSCKYACPSQIPRIIPGKKHVIICDLCNGDPECVKICNKVGYNALKLVSKPEGGVEKTFLRSPYELSRDIYHKILNGGNKCKASLE
ncbi:MAG: 4Fe-4S dicluster domain-containing protein [Desulfurococcaceae archaeon]